MAARIRETPIWKRLFRVSPSSFDALTGRLEPLLERQVTQYRKPVAPAVRIAAYLMYARG